jgi:hypothetical protein
MCRSVYVGAVMLLALRDFWFYVLTASAALSTRPEKFRLLQMKVTRKFDYLYYFFPKIKKTERQNVRMGDGVCLKRCPSLLEIRKIQT